MNFINSTPKTFPNKDYLETARVWLQYKKTSMSMTLRDICCFLKISYSLQCYRLLMTEIKETNDYYVLTFCNSLVDAFNEKREFKRTVTRSDIDTWIDEHSVTIIEAIEAANIKYTDIIIMNTSTFVFHRGEIIKDETLKLFKNKLSSISQSICLEFATPL